MFAELNSILAWFSDWKAEIIELENEGLLGNWKKAFISSECWFDLQLAVLGFIAVGERYLSKYAELSPFMKPKYISQNKLEGFFGVVRGGQGSVTAKGYENQVNTQRMVRSKALSAMYDIKDKH